MKLYLALIGAAAGCLLASSAFAADLKHDLEEMVTTAPAKMVVIYVTDSATSEVLVNRDGEKPAQPASCNKLLTTAVGMSLLGEDFTYETKVCTSGAVEGQTLKGDVVVIGTGDPTISGRFADNKRDVTWIMREWAQKIAAKVKSIDGDIVGDDSYFDELTFHPGWYPAERAEWYEAEINALSFNDNCVDITWSSKGKLPGDIADMRLNPLTDYVSFTNNVKVAAKGRPVSRYYKRGALDNVFEAVGTISIDNTKDDSAAVHDGALYFATVFKDVLTSSGVQVRGKARHERGAGAAAKHELATQRSPKLADVIKVINLNSQNFYAECLGKTLGKLHGSEGSFAAGTEVVHRFMQEHGIYNEGEHRVDGSGLSPENRVTARQLVETLRFMDSGAHKMAWRASLPQGGTRGSLKSRFQSTTETRALAPRIFGKTGLIGGVRSLTGIVNTQSGREVYYSIILNGLEDGHVEEGMALIDALAVRLARE